MPKPASRTNSTTNWTAKFKRLAIDTKTNIVKPLERRGEVPDYIRFSSDKNSIGFEVTQASNSQLGASSNPPAAPEKHDVTMRLHETAVDNYSASLLAARPPAKPSRMKT